MDIFMNDKHVLDDSDNWKPSLIIVYCSRLVVEVISPDKALHFGATIVAVLVRINFVLCTICIYWRNAFNCLTKAHRLLSCPVGGDS